MAELIIPDWLAPPGVCAAVTTRRGGSSLAPFDSLNLGDHVGDDPRHVLANRARLSESLRLPAEPMWLTQVHGCDVIDCALDSAAPPADAAYSDRPDRVCAVLTADCLPLLLCNRHGSRVAAVHAGWRGLAGGVIEAALMRFNDPADDLLAWLGPAIGPQAFEVGEAVHEAFVGKNQDDAAAFHAVRPGHWLADIYQLATARLQRAGVRQISGGGLCTFSDTARFFSYRRDGATGRMASLVWLAPGN